MPEKKPSNRDRFPVGEAWYEVAFGALYPLIYGHRDQEEAQRCLQLLKKLLPLGRSGLPVLDLGCGDARHLELLAQAGVPAVGLDLSATLLDLGRKRSAGLNLVQGDMRRLGFRPGCFDSVLSLFTAFGYFGPLAENAVVVEEVARVLQPGGYWVLDYFNGDKVRGELASGQEYPRERKQGSWLLQETRRYDAEAGQVFKEVVVTKVARSGHSEEEVRYTEQVAVFSLGEIDKLAAAKGLFRVEAAGSYDGLSLSQGDRWILVYQKAGGGDD